MHSNCRISRTFKQFRILIFQQNTGILRHTTIRFNSNNQKLSKQIGFIGDGNMAKAICRSVADRGIIAYSQVHVSGPYMSNLSVWKEWGANVTTDNNEVAQRADIIFLAVKPHILDDALRLLDDATIKNKLFVSILAGFTLKYLEGRISRFAKSRIIRIMPNTPMLVNEGCTIYCPGRNVTDEDLSNLLSILESTGVCIKAQENVINAAGAIAASGPAFVYLFIEALSDGGVRMGLHRDMATKLALQTVFGAAKLAGSSSKHVAQLKDEVCSAGGTTIAGVHALEGNGFRGAVMDAIEAAAERASEIGNK